MLLGEAGVIAGPNVPVDFNCTLGEFCGRPLEARRGRERGGADLGERA